MYAKCDRGNKVESQHFKKGSKGVHISMYRCRQAQLSLKEFDPVKLPVPFIQGFLAGNF